MAAHQMDIDTSNTHSPAQALFKLLLAWMGYVLGSITLQQVVLALTGVYTMLQIYLLVRDKIIRDRAEKERA
jgi:hypothetical protein